MFKDGNYFHQTDPTYKNTLNHVKQASGHVLLMWTQWSCMYQWSCIFTAEIIFNAFDINFTG